MRVVIYARVSDPKQADKELPIASQLKALHKYATNQGWEVIREYVDEGKTARTAHRRAFQDVVATAKQEVKSFDAILVWKFSRFARNREDSILYKALLRRRGIDVISLMEPTDDSPSGRMLEGMIEVIDEFFSANLAVDTMRGMIENAERGYRNGARIPTGYKAKKVMMGSNQKTTLEIDETYGPLVERIFRMYLSGNGAKEIVSTLNSEGIRTPRGNAWTKNTVFGILKREEYTGTLVWNQCRRAEGAHVPKDETEVIRIPNAHPGLIDRASFEKVRDLLTRRSSERLPGVVRWSSTTRIGGTPPSVVDRQGRSCIVFGSSEDRNQKVAGGVTAVMASDASSCASRAAHSHGVSPSSQ
jgi:site-specific DNA recombinase